MPTIRLQSKKRRHSFVLVVRRGCLRQTGSDLTYMYVQIVFDPLKCGRHCRQSLRVLWPMGDFFPALSSPGRDPPCCDGRAHMYLTISLTHHLTPTFLCDLPVHGIILPPPHDSGPDHVSTTRLYDSTASTIAAVMWARQRAPAEDRGDFGQKLRRWSHLLVQMPRYRNAWYNFI